MTFRKVNTYGAERWRTLLAWLGIAVTGFMAALHARTTRIYNIACVVFLGI